MNTTIDRNKNLFDDDKIGNSRFPGLDVEDGELLEEDTEVDMFDTSEEGYYEDEEGEQDDEENTEVSDEYGADDYGVEVDASDIGASTDDDETEDYELIQNDASFINANGQIQVMDTSSMGEDFKLQYIDIENIAIVKRIRKHKNVDDLVKSIRDTGLLTPVVVALTATEGVVVLLSGYRRVLACAKIGIRRIPCIINTKVNTPEIPILEAMYNHSKPYGMKEIIDYIEYLEKEKGILSASMIEYLLQMENGDYTKLKDILNDNDDDIVSRLMAGQLTIGQAFKKLEQRRKNESREEKDMKKVEKVYQNSEESGADQITGTGEVSDGSGGLTDDEIASLAISADSLEDGLEDSTLEEMVKEGDSIEGFKPHKQDPGHREILDPALRKAVLVRDNNTCQICKDISGQEYVEVLDVHHIVEVYLNGDDSIENLITTCVCCHKLIHLYARGELYIRPLHELNERDQEKFKRIVKLGNVIRKGLALKGMKKEDLKKVDNAHTIGRTKPGTGQVAG